MDNPRGDNPLQFTQTANGVQVTQVVTPQTGAQPGNSNAEKFDTPEKRKKLLEDYLQHKRDGYSDESFVPCNIKTFKNYVEKYPMEFPTELIEDTYREYMKKWETIGNEGTQGKIKGFNANSWQFNMMNRFKGQWKNREDHTTDDKPLPESKMVIIDTKPKDVGGRGE